MAVLSSTRLRRCVGALSVLAALFASAAGPAGAAAPLRQERVYLACGGSTPVQGANRLVAEDANPTWTTAPPSSSLTDGGGCTMQDLPIGEVEADGGRYHLVFGGTWAGNIDRMTFDLYQAWAPTYMGEYRVFLYVDGKHAASGDVHPVATITSPDFATRRIRFAIDGLGIFDETGETPHDVLVRVEGPWNAFDPVTSWVWGAEEVPAAVIFNGETGGLPVPQP